MRKRHTLAGFTILTSFGLIIFAGAYGGRAAAIETVSATPATVAKARPNAPETSRLSPLVNDMGGITAPGSNPGAIGAKSGGLRRHATERFPDMSATVMKYSAYRKTNAVESAAGQCELICSDNVVAEVSQASSACGVAVDFPVPEVPPGCGEVKCEPPPGSFFRIGNTVVTCTGTTTGLTCAFTVTVTGPNPVSIQCPQNIVVSTASGASNATVDYVPATASDACGVANLVCLPPSGSTFPLGVSTVTCTATDPGGIASSCPFTITVRDGVPPAIQCPPNVTATAAADQSSVIVTYPPPTATDNLPGTTTTCTPPSGSAFALGATSVTCTAIDAAGNRANCSFVVNVGGGLVSLQVIIPGGKSAVELGAQTPLPVKPKSKKASGPCGAFSVENNSFARVVLTLDTINRTGADVSAGRIADPRELGLYQLSLVNSDAVETPLAVGEALAFGPGETKNFCLRANPTLPPVAGATTGLSATQVVPDLITSTVTFKQVSGASLPVNVQVHVDALVRFINATNPRRAPALSFTSSGDTYQVAFAVFDANTNVSHATYEFLDASGSSVAGPFDVDLAGSVRDRNLVRGQSFVVTQSFSGASSHPEVNAIRVTVFDAEGSDVSPATTLGSAAPGLSRLQMPVAAPSGRLLRLDAYRDIFPASPVREGLAGTGKWR